jgi:hypothetical protein
MPTANDPNETPIGGTPAQAAQLLTTRFDKLTEAYENNTREIGKNTTELARQHELIKRLRIILLVGIIGFCADVAVTAGLVIDHRNTDHAIAQANNSAFLAKEGVVTSCDRGNQTKRKEAIVFNRILHAVTPLIPGSDVVEFKGLIASAYAPRICGPKLKNPNN